MQRAVIKENLFEISFDSLQKEINSNELIKKALTIDTLKLRAVVNNYGDDHPFKFQGDELYIPLKREKSNLLYFVVGGGILLFAMLGGLIYYFFNRKRREG